MELIQSGIEAPLGSTFRHEVPINQSSISLKLIVKRGDTLRQPAVADRSIIYINQMTKVPARSYSPHHLPKTNTIANTEEEDRDISQDRSLTALDFT